MKGEEKLEKINILIGGRSYPIQVEEDERSLIEQTVLTINRELGEFQQQYTKSDKQDCLAMLLLTQMVKMAKQNSRTQSNNAELDPVLNRLEAKLSEF